VHVHYLLSSHTVDEQMWDLVDQKWAARRAVQDREAQHKTEEAILAEAALAKAVKSRNSPSWRTRNSATPKPEVVERAAWMAEVAAVRGADAVPIAGPTAPAQHPETT
jgi:hypothetical protein